MQMNINDIYHITTILFFVYVATISLTKFLKRPLFFKEKNLGKFYFKDDPFLDFYCWLYLFIEVVMLYLFIEVVWLCPSGLLLFLGNEAEWPMFCRNIDSFLFRQISGARCPLFSKDHAEIFCEFRHDLCYKLGHIACPWFAAPGRNQRSWKT